MTTTSKTYSCKVEYGMTSKINDDSIAWIIVTSPSGNSLSFETIPNSLRELVNKITDVTPSNGVTELTRDEMIAFKTEHDKLTAPVPTPTPTPSRNSDMNVSLFLENYEGRFIGFTYDIPSSAEITHPSKELQRYARRWQLSNWIVPIKQLRRLLPLMEAIRSVNGDCLLIEYATSMDRELSNRAKANFASELADIHTSMLKTLDSASEQYESRMRDYQQHQMQSPKQLDQWEQYRNNRIVSAIREAERKLESAIACAMAFDDSGDYHDLFNALRDAIAAKREAAKITYNITRL